MKTNLSEAEVKEFIRKETELLKKHVKPGDVGKLVEVFDKNGWDYDKAMAVMHVTMTKILEFTIEIRDAEIEAEKAKKQ